MRYFLIFISLLCFSNSLFAQNIQTYPYFKAQTVAFKKPNPDPIPDFDEDINEIPFVNAIQKWICAFFLELSKKSLDKTNWRQVDVMDAFDNELLPIVPILGKAVNSVTNTDNKGSKYQAMQSSLEQFDKNFLTQHYNSNKKIYKAIETVEQLGLPAPAYIASWLIPEKVENTNIEEKVEQTKKDSLIIFEIDVVKVWANAIVGAIAVTLTNYPENTTFNTNRLQSELKTFCEPFEKANPLDSSNLCNVYVQKFHEHINHKLIILMSEKEVDRNTLLKALHRQDFNLTSKDSETLLSQHKKLSPEEFLILLKDVKSGLPPSDSYAAMIKAAANGNNPILRSAPSPERRN